MDRSADLTKSTKNPEIHYISRKCSIALVYNTFIALFMDPLLLAVNTGYLIYIQGFSHHQTVLSKFLSKIMSLVKCHKQQYKLNNSIE